jgi:hypothetical protein
MRMKAFAAVALLISGAAHAGPYSDDLAKCLVSSTSKADRVALVRWMFAAAAAHPAVASIAKVSPKIMDEANAATGALFMRLLTESCKDKAQTALQYEGPATIQTSFTVLGQVAASELFSSPEVKQAMSGLEKNVDSKKLQELMNK